MHDDRDHSNICRPVVGVLINNARIEKLNAQNHNFKGYFWFEELFKANERVRVTLYAFSARDVDAKVKRIVGTYLDSESGTWKQETFPYPDVLYIRGASGGENSDFKKTLRDFEAHGVKRINAKYLFDKWHLYKHLKKDMTMRSYLPRTVRIQNADDLRNFLQKYPKIYVKAYYGSQGKQVVFISKLATGGYRYSYNYLGKLSTGDTKDAKSLYGMVRTILGTHRILAQAAIRLIQLNGKNVDFRAEVQRNGSGDLDIVSIAARIGTNRSPITTHGDVREFLDFLQNDLQYTNSRYTVSQEQVYRFLHLVYNFIERTYGPFGDLGIDFAVDRDGRLWIIECNARSAKVSFQRSAPSYVIERAFTNPLEYAKYLYAGGTPHSTDDSPQTTDGTEASSVQSDECGTSSYANAHSSSTKLIQWYPTIQLKPLWSERIPQKKFRSINMKPLWQTDHNQETNDATQALRAQNGSRGTTSYANDLSSHTKSAQGHSTIRLKPLWSNNHAEEI